MLMARPRTCRLTELCAAAGERHVVLVWHPQSVQTAENSGNRTGRLGLRIEF